jgi:DNA processing protein
LALEYGRDVFAVPGNIFSALSKGTLKLIKEGAFPVSSAQDILEVLNISPVSISLEPGAPLIKQMILSKTEGLILAKLGFEPVHVNELVRKSGLDTPEIISTLTIMELKGMVRNVGRMEYVRL